LKSFTNGWYAKINVIPQALVFACGVRKVWARELKDLDTPSRQISHIRGVLSELGMKGRFSMEQAKAIKAKRELAQEMGELCRCSDLISNTP
jgi:hypothetical protein